MTSFQRARFLVFVPLLGLSILAGCSSSSSDGTAAATEAVVTEAPPADSTTSATGDSTAEAAGSTAAATADATPAAAAADTTAFSDCLKEQGVELPEGFTPGAAGANPGSIPEGLDLAKLQPALAACQDKLPAGAGLPGLGAGGSGGLGGLGGADFSAYTTCLKDNGVAIPEPFDPSKLDLADPNLATAATTCQPLLPAGIHGVGAGAPSTTVAA